MEPCTDSRKVFHVPSLPTEIRTLLDRGAVIPAMPLALTASRRLDERHQRGLIRYYAASGAGGLAVGVHTTQFAIRDPSHGLFDPVLALAAEELDRADSSRTEPLIRVAGLCGNTSQAVSEAELARDLGFHAGLLSLAALRAADDDALIDHCQTVARVIPLFGFYLQKSVGGRTLSYRYWRRFAELDEVVAVKIAPFNRYQTFDVIRAVAEAGRDDIALYTGNDDAIVQDLVTPYRIEMREGPVQRRIVGGLLGHWSVWTSGAVRLLEECHAASRVGRIPSQLLRRGVQVTDANAAFFDAAHDFLGCIAGLHEVLRRQGLLAGTWCLDPDEGLSPGQREEIDRVHRAYPELNDDAFVDAHRDAWLSG
jgi:hypothetical protein